MVVLNFYGKIEPICISEKLGLYIANLPNEEYNECTVGAILYAMQFSIFARSFSLIAAEHPVKVAGITKAAAICDLRDGIFGGA